MTGKTNSLIIGSTGCFEINKPLPISELWVKKSSFIKDEQKLEPQVTYSFIDNTKTDFDKIVSYQAVTVPVRTFQIALEDLINELDIIDEINGESIEGDFKIQREITAVHRLRFFKEKLPFDDNTDNEKYYQIIINRQIINGEIKEQKIDIRNSE